MNDEITVPPPAPAAGTQRIIVAGFAVVLVLLAALATLGLVHMASLKARMGDLAAESSLKTESVYVMSRISRERYASLGMMAMLDDPFERDAEYLQYMQQASTFVAARDRLLEAGMSPVEKAIWERIRALIHEDQRAHEAVAELALAGKGTAARLRLLHEVRPLDNALFDMFDALVDAHRETERAALEAVDRAYRQAASTTITLAGLAFVTGLVVAWVVARRSQATEAALSRQSQAALAAAEQLSWAASHDSLTVLANRREALRRLRLLVQEVQAQGARHVLLYVDLDRFKTVNDRCGHMAGDELLRQLAEVFSRHVRSGDLLARLGGDEFLVALTHCDLDNARQLANALRDDIARYPFEWEGRMFTIGASIGLIAIEAGMDAAAALKAADAACYRAKGQGRNVVSLPAAAAAPDAWTTGTG